MILRFSTIKLNLFKCDFIQLKIWVFEADVENTSKSSIFSYLDETVVINAKRFLIRPELHFKQVHGTKSAQKKMELNIPVLNSFFQKKVLLSGKFSLFTRFI